jgi:hypothetical protein
MTSRLKPSSTRMTIRASGANIATNVKTTIDRDLWPVDRRFACVIEIVG